MGNEIPLYEFNRDVTIVIAGLEKAGKTSLVSSILGEGITDIYSTLGVSQETIKISNLKIGLADLGGKEAFRKTLWKSYIEKADGLIYVIDCTNTTNLDEAKEWLKISCEWASESTPILILLNTWNKKIKEKEVTELRTSILNIVRSCKTFKSVQCFETSPITQKNLEKAMDWLASTIAENLVKKEIRIESFIVRVKVDRTNTIEAKILGSKEDPNTDLLFTLIQNKIGDKKESRIEYIQLEEKQILLASDSLTTCALLTEQRYSFKGVNLLLHLLSNFMKEIQNWVQIDRSEGRHSDFMERLTDEILEKQKFWQVTERPIFEISYIEGSQDLKG